MLTIADHVKKAKEHIAKLTVTSTESNSVLLVMAFQEINAAIEKIEKAEAPAGGDGNGN